MEMMTGLIYLSVTILKILGIYAALVYSGCQILTNLSAVNFLYSLDKITFTTNLLFAKSMVSKESYMKDGLTGRW